MLGAEGSDGRTGRSRRKGHHKRVLEVRAQDAAEHVAGRAVPGLRAVEVAMIAATAATTTPSAATSSAPATTWTWVPVAAFLLTLLAVAFTIGSFWWMQLRRGRLEVSDPSSFAMSSSPTLFVLRLPMTIRNTGAKTLVIEDMRLRFTDRIQPLPLPWRRVMSHLRPDTNETAALPSPVVLAGRSAVVLFAEFGAPMASSDYPGNGVHQVQIEAVVADRKGWQDLKRFGLRVEVRDPSMLLSYLAYPNTAPEPMSPDVTSELLRVADELRG